MQLCNVAISHSNTWYDILGEMFKLKLWIITPLLSPCQPHSRRHCFCRTLYLQQLLYSPYRWIPACASAQGHFLFTIFPWWWITSSAPTCLVFVNFGFILDVVDDILYRLYSLLFLWRVNFVPAGSFTDYPLWIFGSMLWFYFFKKKENGSALVCF